MLEHMLHAVRKHYVRANELGEELSDVHGILFSRLWQDEHEVSKTLAMMTRKAPFDFYYMTTSLLFKCKEHLILKKGFA